MAIHKRAESIAFIELFCARSQLELHIPGNPRTQDAEAGWCEFQAGLGCILRLPDEALIVNSIEGEPRRNLEKNVSVHHEALLESLNQGETCSLCGWYCSVGCGQHAREETL